MVAPKPSQNGTIPYASGIATLDAKKGRVTLLSEVARSAGWDDLGDTEALIAEFIAPGHYRLHRRSEGERLLRAAEQSARYEIDERDREVHSQIIADKYREVVYHRGDNNRVWLKDEVIHGLFPTTPLDAKLKVFLQAGHATIDLMTNAYRLERMARAADES